MCLLQENTELVQSSPKQPPEAVQEELDFLFDEEMERLAAPRKNTFTDWSDDDSDDELDDRDVNKILIVTQTPLTCGNTLGAIGQGIMCHVPKLQLTSPKPLTMDCSTMNRIFGQRKTDCQIVPLPR